MGMGPRRKDNDMRDSQGKIIGAPKAGHKPISREPDNVMGEGGKTEVMVVKQYKHTGKKYSGPNYPQKDKTIVPFGGK